MILISFFFIHYYRFIFLFHSFVLPLFLFYFLTFVSFFFFFVHYFCLVFLFLACLFPFFRLFSLACLWIDFNFVYLLFVLLFFIFSLFPSFSLRLPTRVALHNLFCCRFNSILTLPLFLSVCLILSLIATLYWVLSLCLIFCCVYFAFSHLAFRHSFAFVSRWFVLPFSMDFFHLFLRIKKHDDLL